MRLACERHLRDLAEGSKRGLRFNPDAAQYAIAFFGFLRHSKGEWARRRFRLEPWQKFIVGSVFGWMRADGTRRFRTVYDEIARKNGKSSLLAGVGLFLLVADGEPGAEVYAAATKREQARIIFGEAQRMVRKSPPLLELVEVYNLNISVPTTESKFEPLSSDDKTADGLNPSGLLVDELHKHKTRALLDVLDTAIGARQQPILWIITTAGDESNETVYAQEYDYARKVVEGTIEDDSLFVYIATIDDGDDPFDPACWPKANPNLGVSVKIDDMRRQADKARKSPSSKNSFLRLRLNVRTSSTKHAFGADLWKSCGGPVDLAALEGRRCWGGLDLSGKNDLTALVFVFEPAKADGPYEVVPFFWVPKDELVAKEDRDRVPYQLWQRSGYLHAPEGRTIDYGYVAARLGEFAARHRIDSIAFDRWGIDRFISAADAIGVGLWLRDKPGAFGTGIAMVPWGQGFKDMGPAVEALEDTLLQNKLRHGNHPVLTWNAASAVLQQDPAGSRKFAKNKSTGRIDGIVALAMALALAKQSPTMRSVYEERGLVTI